MSIRGDTVKILSYGATGSQGFPVAQGLLAKGHQVNVVVRHPDRAEPLKQQGATVFQGDLGDPQSLIAAHQGVEAVFLMLPFGSGGNPVAFMQNALEQWVRQHANVFVPAEAAAHQG
jgi:uncharacterized protein YbjT (DUF2867 family)